MIEKFLTPNLLSKYDFIILPDDLETNFNHEKIIQVSAIEVAKHWFETTQYSGNGYIIADLAKGKQVVKNIALSPDDADFLLVTDDTYEIDIENLSHKPMFLCCKEMLCCKKEANSLEHKNLYMYPPLEETIKNSLSAKHLAHGGNVQFFDKPWPFFYAYLKHKFGENILILETNKYYLDAAKRNNIDSIIINQLIII